MATQLQNIRERLGTWWQMAITTTELNEMLTSLKSKYSIAQLSKAKVITPIKKGQVYINNQTQQYKDPYIVGALYFGDDPYMFGGLAVYNRYWLTTQVPDRYTIYNTKNIGKKVINQTARFIFKKVRASFFYGYKTQKIWAYTVKIMTPERALIQMIKEWSNREFIKTLPASVDKKRLLSMAKKYASKSLLAAIVSIYGK